MTKTYQKADDALQQLRRHNFPEKFIDLGWVHAHDDSALNDKVDGLAKAAALIVKYLYEWEESKADEQPLFSVNEFIGLQTAKREFKALITDQAERRWNEEVLSKFDCRFKKELYRWRIPKRRDYGKELEYLDMKDAVMRMQLYTCTLPTNFWRAHSGHDRNWCDPYCENMECRKDMKAETMLHFLMKCPAYKVQRARMKETICKIQRAHNRKSREDKDIKPIEVIMDWNDERILKKMLFPSKRMTVKDRVDILKAVFDYVDSTERFNDILTFNWS